MSDEVKKAKKPASEAQVIREELREVRKRLRGCDAVLTAADRKARQVRQRLVKYVKEIEKKARREAVQAHRAAAALYRALERDRKHAGKDASRLIERQAVLEGRLSVLKGGAR